MNVHFQIAECGLPHAKVQLKNGKSSKEQCFSCSLLLDLSSACMYIVLHATRHHGSMADNTFESIETPHVSL